MSVSLKVIHGCNHIVTTKDKIYGRIKMNRSHNPGFPDKLPANIQIIRIDSIQSLDGKEYSKSLDYDQKVSKDIIEWINPSNNPLLGEEYFIDALYLKTTTNKFDGTDCSRCAGNGWYVDILGEESVLLEGRNKLAQDFIKLLFTEKNNNYGSNIRDVLAKNVNDEIELGINISSSISECAEQMKKIQSELASAGVTLDEDEILDEVVVYNSIFSREECACYVSLGIKNMSGKDIDFSFKI